MKKLLFIINLLFAFIHQARKRDQGTENPQNHAGDASITSLCNFGRNGGPGDSRKNEDLEDSGNLTFHGITKVVQFKAVSKMKQNGLEVAGVIPVSLEAYTVERPSFMVVKTDDTIKINFHLEFYP